MTFGTVVVRSVTSRTRFPVALMCLALVAAGCTGLVASETREQGIHKIQHVIVIMQENRSFDSYFGTYPGVEGLPVQGGVPAVCVPWLEAVGPGSGVSSPSRGGRSGRK